MSVASLTEASHDRRIPRSRERPRLQVDGGLLRRRTEKLVVGGDRTELVDGVLRQVALVQDVVGAVGVHGVLCFVDADWPLFGGTFAVQGVDVCWPKRLAGLEGMVDVVTVADADAARFPPAWWRDPCIRRGDNAVGIVAFPE